MNINDILKNGSPEEIDHVTEILRAVEFVSMRQFLESKFPDFREKMTGLISKNLIDYSNWEQQQNSERQ